MECGGLSVIKKIRMETTIITIALLIIIFIVGIFVGKNSHYSSEIYYDLYDVRLAKLGALETKVFMLETENNRLNFLYENLTKDKRMFAEYMASHCLNCNRNFYAKTPQEQDVANLLKNITLSSEEIAKRLDIKIN